MVVKNRYLLTKFIVLPETNGWFVGWLIDWSFILLHFIPFHSTLFMSTTNQGLGLGPGPSWRRRPWRSWIFTSSSFILETYILFLSLWQVTYSFQGTGSNSGAFHLSPQTMTSISTSTSTSIYPSSFNTLHALHHDSISSHPYRHPYNHRNYRHHYHHPFHPLCLSASPDHEATVESSSSSSSSSFNVSSRLSTSSKQHHQCKFCQATFASRNALFRHIQNPTEDCLALQLADAIQNNQTHDNKSPLLQGLGLHSTVFYKKDSINSIDNSNVNDSTPIIIPMVEETLVLLVGYDTLSTNVNIDIGIDTYTNINTNRNVDTMTQTNHESESQYMARILPKAFQAALEWQETQYHLYANTISSKQLNSNNKDKNDEENERVISMTQSTAARMRHLSLAQERNCAAMGDVFVLAYDKYMFPMLNKSVSEYKDHDFSSLSKLLQQVNHELQQLWETEFQSSSSSLLSSLPPRVLAVQTTSSSFSSSSSSSSISSTATTTTRKEEENTSITQLQIRLHAERSCTQRIYQYLLPVSWLPNGLHIQNWCLDIINATTASDEEEKETITTTTTTTQNDGYNHTSASTMALASTITRNSIRKSHNKRHNVAPPAALKELKQILKGAESPRFSPNNNGDKEDDKDDKDEKQPQLQNNQPQTKKKASGRFGALAHRERRCWHNFADPALMGMASPSNEPVWRSLDRARSGQFLLHVPSDTATTANNNHNNNTTTAIAILEFCGDGFVQQQIRRIVGTAVAMVYGWLPSNFWEIATRPDVVIETPLAPRGRMYFSEARFHFDELRSGKGRLHQTGGTLFEDAIWIPSHHDSNDYDNENQSWMDDIQTAMLNRCSTKEKVQSEEEWLKELRDVVTPRIRKQLAQWMKEEESRCRTADANQDNFPLSKETAQSSTTINSSAPVPTFLPPPLAYQHSLALLRNIIATKTWPVTSAARSKVIRSTATTTTTIKLDMADSTAAKADAELGIKAGSFTVVNPSLFQPDHDNNNYFMTADGGKVSIPKANALFPELAQAVFDLERDLTQSGSSSSTINNDRPPSTHCAVNCNAEFTPHVDSGRGKGQSLSMIVGLGDFMGGGLMVEGTAHDILYQPLEFDGWKQRHWTQPFEGERFSLVWFSPEL